jgi:3-hydroxyisobutyrate dehydrogenase-like beta-hydroxyacid dehydrogenase
MPISNSVSLPRTDVSLLGTGLLGGPVVRRLLATGLAVTAWNRTSARAEAFREAGAAIAGTAAEALGASPVSLLFLSDAPAIREVLASEGAAAAVKGKTVIQMGTISPGESRDLSAVASSHGASWMEAPVLGSGPQAIGGTLFVLAGGRRELFSRWRPLLLRLGTDPLYVGETGKAAALKLALNNLIGSLTTSFAASLAMVRAQGIDPEIFMKVLRPSALYAPTFDKKLGKMLERDFSAPSFPVRHMLKDMRLAAGEAEAGGVDAGVARAVCAVLEKAVGMGLGEADYSALSAAVEGAAAVSRP